jgi:hypothetical protein
MYSIVMDELYAIKQKTNKCIHKLVLKDNLQKQAN